MLSLSSFSVWWVLVCASFRIVLFSNPLILSSWDNWTWIFACVCYIWFVWKCRWSCATAWLTSSLYLFSSSFHRHAGTNPFLARCRSDRFCLCDQSAGHQCYWYPSTYFVSERRSTTAPTILWLVHSRCKLVHAADFSFKAFEGPPLWICRLRSSNLFVKLLLFGHVFVRLVTVLMSDSRRYVSISPLITLALTKLCSSVCQHSQVRILLTSYDFWTSVVFPYVFRSHVIKLDMQACCLWSKCATRNYLHVFSLVQLSNMLHDCILESILPRTLPKKFGHDPFCKYHSCFSSHFLFV